MKTLSKYLVAICLLLSFVGSAQARTVVLGDSLSDAGNLFNFNNALVPNPPFPDGQFTNGSVWATQIGSDFDSGLNFAFGGATALASADGIPSLENQTATFILSDANAPGNANIAIWIGANDLLGALADAGLVSGLSAPATLSAAPAAVDLVALETNLFAVADQVVETIAQEVLVLHKDAEVTANFVIFGLPELGQTPLVRDLGPEVQALMNAVTLYFNAELEAAVATGDLIDIPTTFFDINGFFQDILDDPAAYGFTNTENACILTPTCLLPGNDPNTFVFYDPIHPTEAVHSIIASEFRKIAPVPGPATLPLLLGGIALVGVVGARRKRNRY